MRVGDVGGDVWGVVLCFCCFGCLGDVAFFFFFKGDMCVCVCVSLSLYLYIYIYVTWSLINLLFYKEIKTEI